MGNNSMAVGGDRRPWHCYIKIH